jgi:hypothetical protein
MKESEGLIALPTGDDDSRLEPIPCPSSLPSSSYLTTPHPHPIYFSSQGTTPSL